MKSVDEIYKNEISCQAVCSKMVLDPYLMR